MRLCSKKGKPHHMHVRLNIGAMGPHACRYQMTSCTMTALMKQQQSCPPTTALRFARLLLTLSNNSALSVPVHYCLKC